MTMLAALTVALLSTASPPEVHAVIVANNDSARGELSRLQFADDDGARYYELMKLLTPRVSLLTVMDADTQRIHPEAARMARAPSRAELESALSTTFKAIEQARDAGKRTVFFFIFVGHGSLDERGEGVVHLADGYFSRADLFRRVLKRSPASINHVIVDACNAYLLVARRGESTAALDRALARFIDEETLSSYPNTGVLLATSKGTDVHEWSRFSAGVFSHEVRSALAGAADVSGDGEVSYAEVKAFVSAANAAVRHPAARLQVYGQPPRLHEQEPLFARDWVDAPVLEIPASLAGRYWLEDERGVRYADFHSANDASVSIVLVPSDAYFLRSKGTEMVVPGRIAAQIDAAAMPRRPTPLRARGATEESYRKDLFSIPFGRAYMAGYRASLPDRPLAVQTAVAPPLSTREWTGTSLLGAAGAALATGIGFGVSSGSLESHYAGAIGTRAEVEDARDRADRHGTIANVAFGTAAALAVTGAILLLWPDDDPEEVFDAAR